MCGACVCACVCMCGGGGEWMVGQYLVSGRLMNRGGGGKVLVMKDGVFVLNISFGGEEALLKFIVLLYIMQSKTF